MVCPMKVVILCGGTRLRQFNPGAFRVIGDLAGADEILHRALFVGVYPGLSRTMLDYMISCIADFVKNQTGAR